MQFCHVQLYVDMQTAWSRACLEEGRSDQYNLELKGLQLHSEVV